MRSLILICALLFLSVESPFVTAGESCLPARHPILNPIDLIVATQTPLVMTKMDDVRPPMRDYSQYIRNKFVGLKKNFAALRKRYGGCVLHIAGLIGFHSKAGNGVGMVKAIKKEQPGKWSDVHPSEAVAGKTICSWSGGKKGLGDVAIFRGHNCWEYHRGCHRLNMTGYRLENCISSLDRSY